MYTSNNADSSKDVPFGDFDDKNLFRVSKPGDTTTKKVAGLGNCRPKIRKI